MPSNSALTNDLGEYRISSLPAGRYFVGVTAPSEADGVSFPRTFFGGTADLNSASPLELSPGGTVQANVTLHPTRSYTVRGTLANLPENIHPYLNLVRKGSPTAANEGHATNVDASTGEFEIRRVTPGAWVLNAGCFDRSEQVTGSAEVVISDHDAEGLVIALAKSAEVTGRITYEQPPVTQSNPPSGRFGVPSGVNVTLHPAAGGMAPALGSQVKLDGSLSFSGMQAGDYLIVVRAAAPYYVKSVLMGGQNIAGIPFPVTSSGAPGPFEVVIGMGAAQLDAAILDGSSAAPGAFVLLLGAGEERIVRADPTGHVSLNSLGPGEYTAYAFSSIDDIEYANPEVMKNFSGTHISLMEGAKQQTEIKLNRTVY
jgi:hypothetical protein